LAAAVSSIVAGYIVQSFGYGIGFASLAGLGILGLLFFLLYVPETKEITSEEPVTTAGMVLPA
ncbi:MAG: transporter, partial [Segetibacter sp.]|nr:transporter [Segetibacter sp.]